VLAWDPSDTTLASYIAQFPDSNATTDEANTSVALLQTGEYNLTPTELATYDADLAAINPELPYLFTNEGIVTDPAYVAYTGTGPLDPTYGGYDPNLVAGDLFTLFTNGETNYTALSNLDTLSFLSDPVPGATDLGGGAVSLLPMDLMDIMSLGLM
jgi:hypothetical protein